MPMIHNEAKARYEVETDGALTYVEYVRNGDTLAIVHTYTPPALRGRGIAGRLVRDMLVDIRNQGLKVDPQCSFIIDYFERHPEERDLIAKRC
jgi:predicted GNAT family acetyltransferase